jgi:hypothetical protein
MHWGMAIKRTAYENISSVCILVPLVFELFSQINYITNHAFDRG